MRSFLLRCGLVGGEVTILIGVLKGAKVGMSKDCGKGKSNANGEQSMHKLHRSFLIAAIQSSVVVSRGRLP